MSDSQAPQPPTPRGSLAWLTLAAVAVRLGFLLLEPETQPVADEGTWTDWAVKNLITPKVSFSPLRTHMVFYPPLYPYFIALVYVALGSLEAVKWVQAALSALLVPAVGRVGTAAFGPRSGLVAAGIVAFYPELIWFSVHFWSETLFMLFLWWAVERLLAADASGSAGAAALAGLLWGLAILTRETALYFTPVAALWLLRSPGRALIAFAPATPLSRCARSAGGTAGPDMDPAPRPPGPPHLIRSGRPLRVPPQRRGDCGAAVTPTAPRPPGLLAWSRGASFALAALLTVAPWTLRNWIVFRGFVPVSTAGGLNLFQGNARLSRQEVYDLVDAVRGRVEQYRYARRMGLQAIRERQPAWLFEKLVAELPNFWEADSLAIIHVKRGAYGAVSTAAARAAAAVILLPYVAVLGFFVLGVASLRLARGRGLLLGFLAYYNLIHVATHGFARYRLPIMPVVFVVAASACVAWRSGELRLESRGRKALAVLLGGLLAACVAVTLAANLRQPAFGLTEDAVPPSEEPSQP